MINACCIATLLKAIFLHRLHYSHYHLMHSASISYHRMCMVPTHCANCEMKIAAINFGNTIGATAANHRDDLVGNLAEPKVKRRWWLKNSQNYSFRAVLHYTEIWLPCFGGMTSLVIRNHVEFLRLIVISCPLLYKLDERIKEIVQLINLSTKRFSRNWIL